jgi:hypothetical protein
MKTQEVFMTHFFARVLLIVASPVLMVVYWRNNMKKIDLEELRMMISYNELGSFFPER